MKPKTVADLVMEMSILPFFPAEDHARLAIVRMVGAMAENEDQVRWLVNVMTSGLYAKWEGPSELRAVFCMKFKPCDGIECTSAVYLDGLNREQLNPGKRSAIESAPVYQLGPGDPVSADPEMSELVTDMVPHKNLNAVRGRPLLRGAIRDGESEYAALQRTIDENRIEDRKLQVRAASMEEIAALKKAQAERAQHPETREILSEQS